MLAKVCNSTVSPALSKHKHPNVNEREKSDIFSKKKERKNNRMCSNIYFYVYFMAISTTEMEESRCINNTQQTF